MLISVWRAIAWFNGIEWHSSLAPPNKTDLLPTPIRVMHMYKNCTLANAKPSSQPIVAVVIRGNYKSTIKPPIRICSLHTYDMNTMMEGNPTKSIFEFETEASS